MKYPENKLDSFDQIIPCGNKDSYVTSIANEGNKIELKDLDKELIKNFYSFF